MEAKFAAVERRLTPLVEEYEVWLREQRLDLGSADEAAFEERDRQGKLLTNDHKRWLADFSRRWARASDPEFGDGRDSMSEEYSVALYFPSGDYIYERRGLSDEAAVNLAKECSERPAAKIGLIERIIITDDGDDTVFEWQYGRGVTFPPRDVSGSEPG
jgi:hypothetical protein